MLVSADPRIPRKRASSCNAYPRKVFRSGPLKMTAKSAEDPVTASVTMSMMGCVKLKVAPGM